MSDFNNDHNSNETQNPRQPQQPEQAHNKRSKNKTKFPWFKTIIVALVAGIIGALLVLGIGKIMESTGLNDNGSSVQEASNSSNGGNTLDGKSEKYDSVNQMINDVSPAIVGVINMQ